jgi:hypothetical protein
MTQSVILPAVNIASTTDKLPVLENSPELQGATEPFSDFLALLRSSLGTVPVAKEVLPAEIDISQELTRGQNLPLEELVDGNSGEKLPLPANESGEIIKIVDEYPVGTVTAAVKKILVKDVPQELAVNNPVDESLLVENPVIATVLLQQPADVINQPIQINPIIVEQIKPENSVAGQLLQTPTARLNESSQLRNMELTGFQNSLPVDAEDSDIALQTVRTMSEELMKPVVRTAMPTIDSNAVLQSLRRIATPVSGNEMSNSHDLTSMLSSPTVTQSPTPVSAQNSSQVLPSLSLNTPFQNTGWNQEVTDKIQWMVSQRIQGAEIKLNPAHLGPMEVKIQMQNDQVTVQLTAAHSVVRDALEAAVPRLKEMFDALGVQLADVDVSEHSFTRQRQQREDNSAHNTASEIENNSPHNNLEDKSVKRWTTSFTAAGRLDLFV